MRREKEKISLSSKHKITGMSPQQCSIRFPGHRPFLSSFCRGSINPESKEAEPAKDGRKKLRLSLSEFLDRKLRQSSALPKIVQEKNRPFSSPVGFGDRNAEASNAEQTAIKGGREELNSALDKAVFEQFKRGKVDEEFEPGFTVDEAESHPRCSAHEPSKRIYPFEDGDEKYMAQKHVVVLGDNPKPKERTGTEKTAGYKKQKMLYNYYANGGGSWDYNKEGVDNDEVGSNEIWEGVGSTTLGGLDWN